MRVVHLVKATGIAGAEAHLLALLPALTKHGIEPILVVLESPRQPVPDLVDRAKAAGVRAQAMPIYADADPTLVFRLWRYLRGCSPDIVHTHLVHADVHGVLAAQLAGVRCVVRTCHNDDRFRYLAPVRAANRLIGRRVSNVIVISEALRGFVTRVEGVPARQVTRIHYGLDAAAFLSGSGPDSVRQTLGLGENDPLVGFVGRLTEQKGVGDLLEAFGRVASEFPAARLWVVGDGPLRRALEAQAARAAPGRVQFSGWRSDVAAVMQSLDVLVVPSHWEGFGLVTLEAMAASRPIIASRVSALPEIVVEGETGWLVPPGDPAALASALREALRDPARARTLGRQGRERLEARFTVRRMAEEHARLYAEVLRSP